MDFMNMMKNENGATTENGANLYTTTGNELCDLEFSIPALRRIATGSSDFMQKHIDSELESKFIIAAKQDPVKSFKWLFYLRDVRGGHGERAAFHHLLQIWINNNGFRRIYSTTPPETTSMIMDALVEYGTYKDAIQFGLRYDPDTAVKKITNTIIKELKDAVDGRPISLIGKWLPSINTSNPRARAQAKYICHKSKLFKGSYKMYRQVLHVLREACNVVENDMSHNKWDKIDYSALPSLAAIRYIDAFRNHDFERYVNYIKKVNDGTAKFNANVTFPYEVIHRYIKDNYTIEEKDDSLEAAWKSLPKLVEKLENTIVVRDGSGSMGCPVSNKVTAMDVGDSLAIYCSDVPMFRN